VPVTLQVGGRPAKGRDLLGNRSPGPRITLPPLQPVLLEIGH